jgi:hypothetical protein
MRYVIRIIVDVVIIVFEAIRDKAKGKPKKKKSRNLGTGYGGRR